MEPTQPKAMPSLMHFVIDKVKAIFRPTTGNIFANTSIKNRVFNFLDHYHAIVFLGLGAFLLLEMIWGVNALQGSEHKVVVTQALRKPATSLLTQSGLVHPSLSLAATSQNLQVGKSYMAVVTANTAKEKTDGITAKIHFDPAAVQVTKVIPGTIFQTYFPAKIDPKAGTITITGITDTTSYFSGTATFATILLTPKTKGQTKLQFLVATNGSASAIAAHKQNILGEVNDLTLTVQ